MKFGKLPTISNVDFSLPKDDPGTVQYLAGLPEKVKPLEVFVGCTGWSMKEWVGKVYPSNAKTKDFLFYYSRQFNTIELNTTHYRTPDEKTIEKWKSQSGPGFHFCPKVLQAISHSRDLGGDQVLLNRFCSSITGLEGKLGSCFMQLPPYFDSSRLPVLKIFIEKWPKELPLGIELRHESWFQNQSARDHLFDTLQEYGIGTVITDVAGRRDVLHQRLTSPVAIIRFVGNNLDPTDYKRVDDWVERLSAWSEAGLRSVYFFTHEPDNILAPDLAAYFIGRMNKTMGLQLNLPALTGKMPGGESPEGQISLF